MSDDGDPLTDPRLRHADGSLKQINEVPTALLPALALARAMNPDGTWRRIPEPADHDDEIGCPDCLLPTGHDAYCVTREPGI